MNLPARRVRKLRVGDGRRRTTRKIFFASWKNGRKHSRPVSVSKLNFGCGATTVPTIGISRVSSRCATTKVISSAGTVPSSISKTKSRRSNEPNAPLRRCSRRSCRRCCQHARPYKSTRRTFQPKKRRASAVIGMTHSSLPTVGSASRSATSPDMASRRPWRSARCANRSLR